MLRCSVLFTYSLAFAASSAFQGLTSLFEIKKHSAESGRALHTHILLTKTKPSQELHCMIMIIHDHCTNSQCYGSRDSLFFSLQRQGVFRNSANFFLKKSSGYSVTIAKWRQSLRTPSISVAPMSIIFVFCYKISEGAAPYDAAPSVSADGARKG